MVRLVGCKKEGLHSYIDWLQFCDSLATPVGWLIALPKPNRHTLFLGLLFPLSFDPIHQIHQTNRDLALNAMHGCTDAQNATNSSRHHLRC